MDSQKLNISEMVTMNKYSVTILGVEMERGSENSMQEAEFFIAIFKFFL